MHSSLRLLAFHDDGSPENSFALQRVHMDKTKVNCDVEVSEELWTSYQDLCEQLDHNALTEISLAVEEYIASVKKENEI